MKDILQDLKKMPYTVPEGYFDSIEERVRPWEAEKVHRGWAAKVTPYLSMAAMFAIIAAVGTLVVKPSGQDNGFQEYLDYLFFGGTGSMNSSLTAYQYYSYEEGTYELSEEDIIQYLIYNGTDAEEISE